MILIICVFVHFVGSGFIEILDSWQIVSSNIVTMDASNSTISGLIVSWNTLSMDWKIFESTSTQSVLPSDLAPWIQLAMISVLLCRTLNRSRAAWQFDRTCLFVWLGPPHKPHFEFAALFYLARLEFVGSTCNKAFRWTGTGSEASCPSQYSIGRCFSDRYCRWWLLLRRLGLPGRRNDSLLTQWRRNSVSLRHPELFVVANDSV